MTSFGDELFVHFLHTDIARDGVCCAEVEVKQFSPIADSCVPATENRHAC